MKKLKLILNTPYALTKNLGERLLEHWSKVYKLSTISLRLLMFMELDQEQRELMVQCLVFFWHNY